MFNIVQVSNEAILENPAIALINTGVTYPSKASPLHQQEQSIAVLTYNNKPWDFLKIQRLEFKL